MERIIIVSFPSFTLDESKSASFSLAQSIDTNLTLERGPRNMVSRSWPVSRSKRCKRLESESKSKKGRNSEPGIGGLNWKEKSKYAD